MLMLSIVSFGKQNKVNNAFKCLISYVFKSNITKTKFCLNGLTYIYLMHYLGYLGDIIQFLHIFVHKMYLFANYCLVFFPFYR